MSLHEAIRATDQFLRWARLHQDDPRPEMLEKCRVEAIEALEKLDVSKAEDE